MLYSLRQNTSKITLAIILTMLIFFIGCQRSYGQTNKPEQKQPDPNKPITITLSAYQWYAIISYIDKTKAINQYSTLPAVDVKNHNDTLGIIQNMILPQFNKQLSDTTGNKK